jgi:putative acetyltransferase
MPKNGGVKCSGEAMMRIIQGDLSDPRVVDLLHIHLTIARAETAPGSAHALDLTGLQSRDISFWTVWDDGTLLGIGALKRLSADHGEVKSMHTAQSMRGRGTGTAMLRHIIATARARGMSRLSLETGSWEYFRPAQALYRRHGFAQCPPFGDYAPDPNSVFMSLDLLAMSAEPARQSRRGV